MAVMATIVPRRRAGSQSDRAHFVSRSEMMWPMSDPLAGGDLLAFVTAVEAGSVHGAADALGLTASAVTKRVQSLERRLATPLLERGRFGVRATDAGRLLYPEAKQALAALRAAEAAVRGTSAPLALAASYTIAEFLLPGWLAAFRATEPELRAKVDVVNSAGVLEAVRAGRVELGFVEGLDPLDGLEAFTVYRDEIVVVVAPGHRWARRRSIAAAELPGEPCFTREAGSGTRAVATAALERVGVELEPALEAASTGSILRALAGGGFALLSVLAAEGFAHLRVSDADLRRDLRVVRRPGTPSRFWSWLEKYGS
jgi:DNA-binding transcriptional LysR family regulator